MDWSDASKRQRQHADAKTLDLDGSATTMWQKPALAGLMAHWRYARFLSLLAVSAAGENRLGHKPVGATSPVKWAPSQNSTTTSMFL